MPISHARIAACVYRCCRYQKRLYICLPSVELSVLRILIISLILNARTAITKYHRLGVFNNRNYFLTVLKAASPESRCLLVWVPLRPLLLD